MYIHSVRLLRDELKEVLSELPAGELYDFILGLIRSCPKKITEEECKPWINESLRPALIGYGVL
jgi:hypothetical protein